VTEETLQSLFVPFGELVSIQLPLQDPHAGPGSAHRGHAFVQFDLAEDAQAAIDNVHDSELFGRVLTCNLANARGAKGKSVWAEAGDWASKTLSHSGADVDAAGAASSTESAAAGYGGQGMSD